MLPPGPSDDNGRKPVRRKYKPFPKTRDGRIDKTRIEQEYYASSILLWGQFAESKRWRHDAKELPWAIWQRKKRIQHQYDGIKEELEERAASLGPHALLQTLKAMKAAPETLGGMLQICNYRIAEYMKEIKYDQEHEAEYQQKLIEWQQTGNHRQRPPKRRFRAYTQDLLFLSKAVTETSELLFKTLGIDNANGVKVDQFVKMVEDAAVKIDTRPPEQAAELMKVTIIGADDVESTLKSAFDQYLDKPTTRDVTPIEEDPPDELVKGEDEEDEADPS
jgi:hypothetical protein